MKDFLITRETPAAGLNKIQGSKDGQILVRVKHGVVILSAKESFNKNPKQLSDIFNFVRLSASINKNQNFFRNITHYGNTQMCDSMSNSSPLETIDFTNVSVSDSGVSNNLQCLYLVVTEASNGLLLNYKLGSLNPICLLNEKIAEFENIDVTGDTILTEAEMSKLRINYLVWMKGLDYRYLSSPIWPLNTSSLFICLTGSSEIWIYKFDCFTSEVSRVSSFELDTGEEINEFGLYCEQSDWMIYERSDSILYIDITVVTSRNRIVIKRCLFDIRSKEVRFEDDSKILEFDDFIANINITKISNQSILSVVLANSICFHNLSERSGKKDVLLNNPIVMDNFVQFFDINNGDILHSILTNGFGGLIHIKFNIKSFEIISNEEFNYFKRISSNELPLFDKINKLNTSETIMIDSLNVDLTGKLIYILYSSYNTNSNIDFSNTKKEPLNLSIIRLQNKGDIDFNNVSFFNSIETSPMYWKSLRNIIKGIDYHQIENGELKNDENTNKMDVDVEMEMEIDIETDSILEDLFLNSRLDKERIKHSINNELPEKEFKMNIQCKIANKVLDLMKKEIIDISSEEDMFIYFQYAKLTGKKIPDKSICKMKVYGTELFESFDVGTIDIQKCVLEGKVTSIEGHQWKICDITLLPIMSPVLRRCTHCGSMKIGSGKGGIFQNIVDSTPLCVFCGGRYDI